ncbi:MAG: chemotaxis protein [Gammaproteobacteria bacterium]|nr:chemotaxis protein [Gammaproteobacteria bacterium]MCW8988009.1 chemotaxis protein [Gammaproteobacteria bacterium]
MAGILEQVDKRTNLVGENRLEILMFRLNGRQTFGINVFKVQEVLTCPRLTNIPQSHPAMRGIATIRNKTIPVIDLAASIGLRPLENKPENLIIITEYNGTVQAFLVEAVDRIVNMNWQGIKSPPKGIGRNNYMTAVTEVDDKLVEIIDVEKILSEIISVDVYLENAEQLIGKDGNTLKFLIADDSMVARNQVQRTAEQLGVECVVATTGKEALDVLKSMADEGVEVAKEFNLVISDIEMPVMDGYTLTSEIRDDARLKDLNVMLHSSLSGGFNESMTLKVKADKFIPKFQAEQLAAEIKALLIEKGEI